MKKCRVLIIDDSVVVRRILNDVLTKDPEIEVVGTAANGRIGIQCVQQLKPDLVTLDIEMPDMNGIEVLSVIREMDPKLPVIMVSTLTEHGAAVTLDALSLGANDYVTKPTNVGNVINAQQVLNEQLVPKIKALCASAISRRALINSERRSCQIPAGKESLRIDVVAIGISTGGPNALNQLLPTLPADFPVPILIVQHMPATFTKLLADRLDKLSAITVEEAVNDQTVLPGHAYFAPGDFHMTLKQFGNGIRLLLDQRPKENSCRPAVDVLFRSVVEIYGNKTLGVIMTGMGQDGLRGCERIRDVGGQILAQDEASSVVWGMPGAISRAGLPDCVLSLNDLSGEIMTRVRRGRNEPSSREATYVSRN